MKHNRFDVARLSLQTLINTYPDSEFVARAKLASPIPGTRRWFRFARSGGNRIQGFRNLFPEYAGGSRGATKAGQHSLPADGEVRRDPTHALRAEEEYRQLIMQYPDSKLLPSQAAPARSAGSDCLAGIQRGTLLLFAPVLSGAIARLKSLVDKYPLYSKADEALYLLDSPTKARSICCGCGR